MDETVAKWILEFLLRKPIEDRIIDDVLSRLPLSNDYRLKKTILLRRIESETSNGSVSENLLDLLESVEESDHGEGKTASHLMKEAYRSVALDCTVRFLDENAEANEKFVEVVNRVWNNRVCKMKGLVSEEFHRSFGDIEAAVCDSDVCGKILMRNTRNEALKAVRAYLKETWEHMGPSFLESLAMKVGNEVQGLRHAEAGSDNPRCETEEAQKNQTPVRGKHIAVSTRHRRGAKISDSEAEDVEESMIKANGIPVPEMDRVQDARKSNSKQLPATVEDSHPGASLANQTLSSTMKIDETINATLVKNQVESEINPTVEVNRTQEALKSSCMELRAVVEDTLPEAPQAAQSSLSARATDNCETTVENQTGPEVLAIPEVDRVQEAPKSNSMKLREPKRGPLLKASQTVNTSSSTMETDNMSNDAVVAKQVRLEIHAPGKRTESDTENIEKKDDLMGDARGNITEYPRKQDDVRKRGLMEPNETSHTIEWDDPIDNSNAGSPQRPRMPSPRSTRVSPLKKHDDMNYLRRRERKKWTPLEEETLRTGIRTFGKGRWKLILQSYPDTFQGRTDVDLKDKWRNMMRFPS